MGIDVKLELSLLCILIGAEIPAFSQEGVDPAVVDPCSYSARAPGLKTFRLVRQRTDKTVAAILRVDEKGRAVLNPKDTAFPKVADLEDLSAIQAEQVLGTARESGTIKTFDLCTQNGEVTTFQIDIRFGKTGIAAYRVRGNGITSPAWSTVQAKQQYSRTPCQE